MPIITIMDIGGWLRSLGLEQYEAAFHANAVGADVLRDLTDRDLQQLGILLGDRRKLLRAIVALDGAFAPAIAPRPTSLPISLETILAAAATRASPEQHGVHYFSPPPHPSPMSSQRRPAEMIGDQPLVSPERTTSWLTASDDRDGDDIQAAEIGEPYEADEYHDDPATPRWRYCLVIVIAVIALAGMGAVGAFAYRAVSGGAVLPALPSIMKAENATNENIQSEGDNRPSDLSRTSMANAGASEEFVSRFPANNEEPPKTGIISPNPSGSPASDFGSAVAALATAPPTPPSSVSPPAPSLPAKVAAPAPAPSSSTPNKTKTAIRGSDGLGKADISAAATKSPAAKTNVAAAAIPTGNLLAPDVTPTHLKQSSLPRRCFRSEGLCRSLLTCMTIRRRRRRLAPVCPRVRQPPQRLPPAGVTRLRWPPSAVRPMPTRSFEVCRPNSPTNLAGANRSCGALILVLRGSITAPQLAPSCQ
jgi:hypothetical protein